jgi:NDP-sugar pyrophosphorylase family protein
VKTFQIKGTWFDIGSKETLEEANEIFAKFSGGTPSVASNE